MHHQSHLRPQNGYRGSGSHGGSGSSDNLAYSGSSGGTNGQARLARPVVKPSASPVNRVKTSEQSHQTYGCADTPVSPGRPNREYFSFTLNGQQINETWKSRPSALTGSPKLSTSISPDKMADRPLLCADSQHASDGHTPRNYHGHWASQQELKVRVLRLPRRWSTQDVYHAMSRFGTVVRIELEDNSRGKNASVSFQ
jgi:RNA-dependent RNA polymerase